MNFRIYGEKRKGWEIIRVIQEEEIMQCIVENFSFEKTKDLEEGEIHKLIYSKLNILLEAIKLDTNYSRIMVIKNDGKGDIILLKQPCQQSILELKQDEKSEEFLKNYQFKKHL